MTASTDAAAATAAASTFYGLLSEPERRWLQKAGTVRIYQAGYIMTMEGEPASSVTVLRHGLATASRFTSAATKASAADAPTEMLLRIYGPGDIIGGEAILGRTDGSEPTRQETVKAITRCSTLVIPAGQFATLYADAGTARAFGLAMARRVQAADEQARIRLAPVAARLAHTLLDLAERTGALDDDGSITIPVGLSQDDLASLTASSRATIARILAEWRRRNLIRTGYRKITITDIRRVRTIAAIADS